MVVTIEGDAVRLDEPEDFNGFKVVVEQGTENQVMQALAHVGRMVDRDTAFIRVDAVRAMAEGRVGDGWDYGFDAMVAYASSKGWMSDDQSEIQAHIEWS
ncbi:MAG: hypothetical protein HYU28_05350 [Actinobacteria bacterium]|nr:hypothetical protein [Actinomycetota bacterium]